MKLKVKNCSEKEISCTECNKDGDYYQKFDELGQTPKKCYKNLTKDKHFYLLNSVYYKCPLFCETCELDENKSVNCLTCKIPYVLKSSVCTKKEDSTDKECEDNCDICSKGICLKCKDSYILSGNACLKSGSQPTPILNDTKIICNKDEGLTLISGHCMSCFEKFFGCANNQCNENSCFYCLERFRTDTSGLCKINDIRLEYEYYGLGKFKLKDNFNVYFRIYLKIKEGLMFNSTINVKATIKKKNSILKEDGDIVEGQCNQVGTAEGKEAIDPSALDFLAKFDCYLKFNNSLSENDTVIVTRATLIKVNNNEENKLLLVDGIVPEGDDIENLARMYGYIYYFNQTDSGECTCKGKKTNIILKGKVHGESEIKDKQYQINISGKDAICLLNRIANDTNDTNSILNCTINNKKMKNFYIKDGQNDTININNDNSTIFMIMKNETGSCLIEEDNVSENYKKTNKIGTGSIAAIVISCFFILSVVVIIIGHNFYGIASHDRTLSQNSQMALHIEEIPKKI